MALGKNDEKLLDATEVAKVLAFDQKHLDAAIDAGQKTLELALENGLDPRFSGEIKDAATFGALFYAGVLHISGVEIPDEVTTDRLSAGSTQLAFDTSNFSHGRPSYNLGLGDSQDAA